jgi:Major Facilitator Superfamily
LAAHLTEAYGAEASSVVYLIETAPPGRRGFAGSMANIGSTSGVLLAAAVAAAAVTFAGKAQLESWAWRLPFLLGGVLATGALLLRRRLRADGTPPKRTRELPLKRAFARDPRTMAVAILFTSGYGVVNYLTMVFFPVYAEQFGGLSEARALQATTVAQALALVIVPLCLANDAFIRRRTLLMIAFAAEFAVALACFLLARDGGLAGFVPAQLAFGAILALVMGTDPAMFSEQIPRRIPHGRLFGGVQSRPRRRRRYRAGDPHRAHRCHRIYPRAGLLSHVCRGGGRHRRLSDGQSQPREATLIIALSPCRVFGPSAHSEHDTPVGPRLPELLSPMLGVAPSVMNDGDKCSPEKMIHVATLLRSQLGVPPWGRPSPGTMAGHSPTRPAMPSWLSSQTGRWRRIR